MLASMVRAISTSMLLLLLQVTTSFAVGAQLVKTAQSNPNRAGDKMTSHAKGQFDVKITPVQDKTPDPALGRLLVEKKYHGGIEASSVGEMITSGNGTKSGGYVLIERVSGALNGRHGSFSLQHSGIMDNGEPTLTIIVVPGSGTDELVGLSGKFTLNLDDVRAGK